LAKQSWLLNNIITCCAGKASIDRRYGYKAQDYLNWRASDDFRQARLYALQLNDGDAEGAELLLSWLARRAELLVEKQWAQIQKLAFALLERERIAGPELHKIMHESK
jgi:hypothetical protein